MNLYYRLIRNRSRQSCVSESFGSFASPATLTELYIIALGRHDAIAPDLCRRVEQLIFEGSNSLAVNLRQYTSSKLYILHVFYGSTTGMDKQLGLPYFGLEHEGRSKRTQQY